MAITADQYITQAILDDSRYVQGGRRVVATSQAMAAANDNLGRSTSTLSRDFERVWQMGELAFRGVGMFGTALGTVAAALAGLSAYSLKAYGDMESLERAIIALDGSAAAAKMQIEDLKDIAKAPGLGFKESVEAYIRIRGSGAGGDLSKELIAQAGNANALSGGDRETFGRIMLALSQILSRDTMQGDEAMQLAEARIPIYDILRKRFGTSDTRELAERGVKSDEVIQALIDHWKELPRVTGGVKNSFENLMEAGDRAAASIGEGMADAFQGVSDDLSKAIENLTDAGVFKSLGEKLAQDFSEVIAGITGTDNIEESMTLLAGYAVYAGAALRNFALQIDDLIGFMKPPAKKLYDKARDALNPEAKTLSPQAEMERFLANALMEREAREAKERQDERRKDPNHVANSPGLQMLLAHEEKLRAATEGGKVGNQETPPHEQEKVRHLRTIARATAGLANVYEQHAFGGGDLVRAGFSIMDQNAANGTRGGMQQGRMGVTGEIKASLYHIVEAMLQQMLNQQKRRG